MVEFFLILMIIALKVGEPDWDALEMEARSEPVPPIRACDDLPV